jgi:hypothetical protein
MSNPIAVPAAYVLNSKCSPEQTAVVIRTLAITPIHCAIVSDIHDVELARQFSELVFRCNTPEDAIANAVTIFKEVDMPVLVVGEAGLLDAVYVDGKREAMNV